MKKSVLLVLLSSVLALGALGASANQQGHGEMFKAADTNNDGKVSYEEFKAQHEKRMDAMFKKLDTNGDGVIDQAERTAAREKMREHRKNCMKKMDDASPAK